MGQALVNINSIQSIPAVSVHTLSISALGGQRNVFRSFAALRYDSGTSFQKLSSLVNVQWALAGNSFF